MHSRLCAFLGLFQGRNHRWPSHLNLGKPSENHWYQWLICKKNIQWWWSRAGKTIEKPSMAMVPWKKKHPIPSLQKNDHRWSLVCILIVTTLLSYHWQLYGEAFTVLVAMERLLGEQSFFFLPWKLFCSPWKLPKSNNQDQDQSSWQWKQKTGRGQYCCH